MQQTLFSRKIVGWAVADTMTTWALPLQALNQAITNAKETAGLVHHSDHGSQYASLVYNERLAAAGIMPSTGSVGDSYDNAMAENINGSYKHEIINTHRWKDVMEVEIATFEWVTWWNNERVHQSLGYHSPGEVEQQYWLTQTETAIIENKVNA